MTNVSGSSGTTAQRIFDRLRDERRFPGGYSSAKEYVCEKELSGQEMFLPLARPPGDAEADFGEALVLINGVSFSDVPAVYSHFAFEGAPHGCTLFRAVRSPAFRLLNPVSPNRGIWADHSCFRSI